MKGAYHLKDPNAYDFKPKAVASQEQMDMIVHLNESLQPSDAIEAALASPVRHHLYLEA